MSLIVGVYFARVSLSIVFFFFNDTATTEIYTLSLHDALPISAQDPAVALGIALDDLVELLRRVRRGDRKSTRLNSSHGYISYAVFCFKQKKPTPTHLSIPQKKQTKKTKQNTK